MQSGHGIEVLGSFVKYRDKKLSLFFRSLPCERDSLRHQFRAEPSGSYSALPIKAENMYAPESKGDSEGMKLSLRDR